MVEWGNYAEAYRAIHDKLEEILAKLDYPSDPAVQDIIDRADRLLGRVYGSQGQQLKQRASTYELMVQLVHQGEEYQAGGGAGGLVQCQIRNSGDTAWINEPFTRDISDRAARDLGKVDVAGFDVPLPAGTNKIGDVDVLSLPSKEYYDRNAAVVMREWNQAVSGNGGWIDPCWTYTVPSGKKVIVGIMFGYPTTEAWGTGTGSAYVDIMYQPSGGTYKRVAFWMRMQGGDNPPVTFTATFMMSAGDSLKARAGNWDNVAHGMGVGFIGTEFDA